jgi:hypothetical protein
MKRVRKYTYLPQEEIEVIETKSGQTIKSKEILDGNYVKAKPAAKKVVKKAVKKVVRKKYAKGGMMMDSRDVVLRIADMMRSYFQFKKNSPYPDSSAFEIENSEFNDLEDGSFDVINIQRGNDVLIIEKDKPDYITFNGKKYYNKDLFEKGDVYYFAYYEKDYFFEPRGDEGARWGLKGQVHDIGTDGLDPTLFIYMFDDQMEFSAYEWDDSPNSMAKGGKLVGNQKKLDVNKNGKLDAEDFKMLRAKKMADGGEIEVGDKVLAKYAKYHATVTEIVDDVEVPYAKITYSDGRVKKADLQNLRKVTLGIAPEYVNPDYMAKGGKTPIVRTQFEEEEFEYANGGRIKVGTFNEEQLINKEDKKAVEKAREESGLKYVDTRIIKKGGKMYMEVYLIPNEEYYNSSKFSKGGYMAKGGMMDEVNTEVIDVKGNIMGTTSLQLKISGMRKPQDFIVYPISTEQAGEPITIQSDTRFGYLDLSSGRGLMSQSHSNGAYSYHFSIDKKVPFKISETDVQKIKEHLSSRASSRAGNSVIFSDNSGAGMMAKGGTINMNKHIWEGWTVGSFIEALDIEFKYHPKFKSRDEVKKWAMESQPYYKKYIPDVVDYYWEKNEEKFADGGMMMTEIMRNVTHYDVTITAQPKTDSRNWANFVTFDTRVQTKDRQEAIRKAKLEFYAMYPNEKIMKIVAEPDTSAYIPNMPVAIGFSDGGKVTDKEVAESNVEMLHSNIKSIKHHAEELEHAIKDNTEVEGWVLAKADRAATAMSDITHYLDGRKMGRGGMVAGHYYKDKAGSDLRYIGPDSKNDDLGIFKDGEKYLTKSFDDFEEEKEKKSFWFGNGGFMPSGFSRKVTLSEKAEEMVGKNTWHILDAAQKGEVIGELISDGALAVTMDRGGIVDAEDWSKSMTQDKIYALKKAGYSENIASEMSLLPYEQLPMWVRQDFKKGSIVIGAYHIHKNDNIPVDGKVLVLNGDEEVVYSAETLDQAQEWAINQMQEVEDEDDGNYIYVSDCCGAEAGSSYDIGICPMCREHCEWEKESTYADGGVTEATKFKVVYKLRDAAEPKEKLFDNAEKAEFFLETIKDDDDIMSANLVEVKPMKKAAEKKAPTNLFAAAKPAAASSASKKTKEDVLVPGIADRIARYDALKAIIKNAEAEKEVIGGALKEVGKEKFLELYELRRRNPETFNLADEDEKIMFIVMDKYIKVEPEKAGMLENYPGLLETTTTYKFNPALLDKTGEIVSRLILESTELSDDEKANLIVAETKIGIKSGSIDRLMDYDNPAQIFDLIEPILALK